MNNFMEKLKNTKILGIVGNALLLIGTFLPMFVVSFLGLSQSVSFIQGADGVIVALLSIASLLIIFADKLSSKVPFFEKLTNQKLTLVTTAISAILLIIAVSSVSKSYGSLTSFGFGFYVMILGLVGAIAYPFLYKGENK